MEAKKNSKVDLEKSKSIFFLVGLLLALAGIFLAFNYSTYLDPVSDLEVGEVKPVEIELVAQTREKDVEKIEPPKPKQTLQILNIVDNETDIVKDILVDAEISEEEMIIPEIGSFAPIIEKEDSVHFVVQTMPKFQCGDICLQKWIASKVKYPEAASRNNIEGKVFVRFCVSKTGKVDKVSIARGVDPFLDKEALRVVSELPTWKPGEQQGKKVSVWYTVPINFVLHN